MSLKLDFDECLKDSPWFRAAMEEAEAEISEFETRLEKETLEKFADSLDGMMGGLEALALMDAQATYFRQGQGAAGRLEGYRAQLGAQLDRLVLEAARQQRDLEQRHALLTQQDLSQEVVGAAGGAAPDAPPMEGYLFKRGSNAFHTWSRRWFFIQSNQLVYVKRAQDPPTVLLGDLRLCTARPCPHLERRFCFQLLSPCKSWLLQAHSQAQQAAWLGALHSSIASALGEGPPPEPPLQAPGAEGGGAGAEGGGGAVLAQVLAREGNGACADCGGAEPRWASVNLGVTLCIECSGIHRGLGVHLSKVRSLTLDSWEPELVKLLCALGNRTLNGIYEARAGELGARRPPPGCARAQREAWIRAKYVHKRFVTQLPGAGPGPDGPAPRHSLRPSPGADPPPGLHPGALLSWAAGRGRLAAMAAALAHGADPGWADGAAGGRTPLLQAVAANSLLGCEFLLQNGASVNQSDGAGRGPLHHATALGHTGLACLFLKRGADASAVDAAGRDPLSIAMELANADIVTLLRLAKMREQEVAQGQPGDDPSLAVFRDISLLASDHPERLQRPPPRPSTL
ncbi:arf-GAP with coiled-coil, ANK repeat and PH domain-containing protein 1 [Eudromia elegans]